MHTIANYVSLSKYLRLSSSGKLLRPDDTLQENDTFVGSGLNPVFAHCTDKPETDEIEFYSTTPRNFRGTYHSHQHGLCVT